MKKRSGLFVVVANISLFILLEVAAILMIANSSIVQRYKIVGVIRDVQSEWWNGISNITHYLSLKNENKLLAEENSKLHGLLLQYEVAEHESVKDSIVSEEKTFDYLGATVIMNTTNRQQNFLILNKGSKSGIECGMGVVTDMGVVGIVEAVTDNYCRVVSFLNASQTISAKLAKNNYFGPMRWDRKSESTAIMSDVSIHCDAVPGDEIVTSGFSAIFPANIPLGTITEIATINAMYKELKIDLFQSFRTLRNVFIVMNRDLSEIKSLEDER